MICHTPRKPGFASTMIKAFQNFKSAKAVPSFKDPSITTRSLPSPSLFGGEIPEPPKPKKSIASNVIAFKPKHPVVQALESAGGAVGSNRELAGLMNVCEAESSKRVQEIPEMLNVRRNGKRVEISLKKSA